MAESLASWLARHSSTEGPRMSDLRIAAAKSAGGGACVGGVGKARAKAELR